MKKKTLKEELTEKAEQADSAILEGKEKEKPARRTTRKKAVTALTDEKAVTTKPVAAKETAAKKPASAAKKPASAAKKSASAAKKPASAAKKSASSAKATKGTKA